MHQSRKLAYPQGYREFESLPVRFFEPPSYVDGGFAFVKVKGVEELCWTGGRAVEGARLESVYA